MWVLAGLSGEGTGQVEASDFFRKVPEAVQTENVGQSRKGEHRYGRKDKTDCG